MSKETICLENLGSNLNNGPEIATDKKVRRVFAVIGNNPSYTALTDDEIVEFSKVNEDCVVAGRAERGYYYRIAFVGNFSLDNMCYAVMRPCRCVLKYISNGMVIKTARYTALNSLSRLANRLKENEIKEVIAYKVELDGTETEIIRSSSADELIADLQSNRYHETYIPRRSSNNETIVEVEECTDRKIEELCETIKGLEKTITEQRGTIDSLLSENQKLKEVIKNVSNCISMI